MKLQALVCSSWLMLMVLLLQSIHIYKHAFHDHKPAKHFCKSIVCEDTLVNAHHDCQVCDFAFGFFTAPIPFYFEILSPIKPTMYVAHDYSQPSFFVIPSPFRRGPPQV